MRLTAVTATRLVALILCVGKATSKCGQVCTSCVPCRSSCGPDEEATPAGVRQQDDFCKPKLTSHSELNKLRTCLCKRGYVRNAWGKCIRREDCYSCRHKANMDFNYCSSSCPETCGVHEQKNCSILCVRGCACAPGYSRLSPGGPCVRPDQCPIGPPAPAPTCPGPHQIYTACPSPCPITCANLNNPPRACPAICGDRHCVCVPGYLAAQENPLKCVPIDECPGREPRRCRGHHQRYTTCKPRCPATCAINGTRICLAGCAGEGCVCRPGYVILRENPLTCVRRQDCPAKPKVCTGPGQRFTTCKSRCPPTCWDNGPQVCTADCAGQGCECMQGFVQLQAKPLVCVRRDKCPAPPQQCLGENQIYTRCKSPCPATCLDFAVPRFCGNKCAGEGCVCKEGFVMLKKTPLKCVRPDQCTPAPEKCTGINQVYSRCKSRCPETCDEPGPRRCTNECAGVGCVCKPGFVQLYEQPLLCVPREQCPAKPQQCSGANQVYTSCKSSCPETCEDRGVGPRVCTANCAGQGCVCKEGYVVLSTNPLVCVLREQCPLKPTQCAGANQVYTNCKSRCPQTCSDNGPKACTLDCAGDGCVCKEGYVQLQDNPLICVRRDQCPARPQQCPGANQVFTKCKSRCPATCVDNGPRVCTADCAGQGCVCQEGYFQLQANPLICVSLEICESMADQWCPGGNQTYTSCKSSCPATCSNLGTSKCTKNCAGRGCVCKRGFVQLRADPLVCVRREDCQLSPGYCPGANQEYSSCKSTCPLTCSDSGPRPCTLECAGQGCVCKQGFVELQNNPLICVRRDQCPARPQQCPAPNQMFTTCKSQCPEKCSDKGPRPCTLDCAGQGCVCMEGYVQLKDEPLVCVPRSQCPEPPKVCKRANQEYTRCKQSCPATCSRRKGPTICSTECNGEGCACKKGSLQLQKRPLVCVTEEMCDFILQLRCPGEHQVYTPCKSLCPKTCADDETPQCADQCGGHGCVCEEGYVQLQADPLICVRRKDCPARPRQCKRPNQVYTPCKSRCPLTCSKKLPQVCTADCAGDGCVCKAGFFELQRKPLLCVSEETCDSAYQWCKGENQMYSFCKSRCPETCSDDGPRYCSNKCGGHGCVCRDGYVQLSADPLKCVSREQCPSVPKSCPVSNQVYTTCKSRCPATCTNKQPGPCTLECAGEGCVCKTGYVQLLEKPLICVRAAECPATPERCSGINQVYTDCKSPCPISCWDTKKIHACPPTCAGQGCECRRGTVMLRQTPLICVEPAQCFGIVDSADPDLGSKIKTAVSGGLHFPGAPVMPSEPSLPTTNASVGPSITALPPEQPKETPPPNLPPLPPLPSPKPRPVPSTPQVPTVPVPPPPPSVPTNPASPVVVPEAPPEVTKVPVQPSKPTLTPPSVPSAPAYPSTPVTPAQPSYPSGYPVTNMIPGAPVYPGVAMYPGASVISPAGVPMTPGGPFENEPAVKTLFNKAHY
uniref:TIL domain containing protein n=1 Tax=Rhipicephalus zambeziensis TaxID=60191 RepID=A0A224YHH5_9ACAR